MLQPKTHNSVNYNKNLNNEQICAIEELQKLLIYNETQKFKQKFHSEEQKYDTTKYHYYKLIREEGYLRKFNLNERIFVHLEKHFE